MLTFEASDASGPRKGDPPSLDGLSLGSGRGESKCAGFIATVAELDITDRPDRKVTFDSLPDDVLLHIFYLYVNRTPDGYAWHKLDVWHTLVRVCQRWRYVVFASPKRLKLRLFCNHVRLAKNLLDVWPSSLPIVISGNALLRTRGGLEGVKNILAALKNRDRISTIDFEGVPGLLWNRVFTMTEPFPELTNLRIHLWHEDIQSLPDSFLGGSCPRLQELHLNGIPFPGLGNLLLSTSDLIDLRLENVPHSGYIEPEAMITNLSVLTKLEAFVLGFHSPRSLAEQSSRHSPNVTRVVFTALTRIQYQGGSAYLEEIVSRIDTPQLESFTITFFDHLVLDTPHLRHFIGRTQTFTALNQADIIFNGHYSDIGVTFLLPDGHRSPDLGALTLGVRYTDSGPRFMSLVRLCSSSLPRLPTLKRLSTRSQQSTRQPPMSATEWVEFLCVFDFVEDLDLSRNTELMYSILRALNELVGERVMEALPALQHISVHKPWQPWASDYPMKGIEPFVAARQLSGRPVVVHCLE